MAQNLKDFFGFSELTVIRCRPKNPKKSFTFSTLVALATIQLINLGLNLALQLKNSCWGKQQYCNVVRCSM